MDELKEQILESGHHYHQVWYVDRLGYHGQYDRTDYSEHGAHEAIAGYRREQATDPKRDRSRFFVVRVDYTQVSEPEGN